jgi:hypothetical protein
MVMQFTEKEKEKLLENGLCRQNKIRKTRQVVGKTKRVFGQVAARLL